MRAKEGKERARRAVLKHGKYTNEAQAQNKEVRDLIRQSKDFLQSIILKQHQESVFSSPASQSLNLRRAYLVSK
jgi:hypothetical protein